jgi:hypothetical protein
VRIGLRAGIKPVRAILLFKDDKGAMSKTDTIIQLLAGTALFKGLSEAELFACDECFAKSISARGKCCLVEGTLASAFI